MKLSWHSGHSGHSGQSGNSHSAHSAHPAKDAKAANAPAGGSQGCRRDTCREIVTQLVADQLATLRPEVRAAVCVEALRRALRKGEPR